MDKKLDNLYELCEIINAKLEESLENLKGAGGVMTVTDIDIADKLTHTLKCIKTTIAMIEAEEEESGGESRRSYRSRRSYDGGNSGRRSYEGGSYDGYSNRRGRSPTTGRYVSRDGGYSGHDGIEDILEDVRDMPESERRKLKMALERM